MAPSSPLHWSVSIYLSFLKILVKTFSKTQIPMRRGTILLENRFYVDAIIFQLRNHKCFQHCLKGLRMDIIFKPIWTNNCFGRHSIPNSDQITQLCLFILPFRSKVASSGKQILERKYSYLKSNLEVQCALHFFLPGQIK